MDSHFPPECFAPSLLPFFHATLLSWNQVAMGVRVIPGATLAQGEADPSHEGVEVRSKCAS